VTAVEEQRINAMATARAAKAARLFATLTKAIGHPPTVADIESLSDLDRDMLIGASKVKVASDGTWKVVRAIATTLEALEATESP
jgi:hypothetical protein